MPHTVAIGALVLGAVLILIAVAGGRFRIFGVEIRGTVGRTGRAGIFNSPSTATVTGGRRST